MSNMGITRRNLVKGAAWTAPAVMVSSVVPAYAASQNGTSPNGKAYYYHNISTITPSGCNPISNPQVGYIDNLPSKSPAGNSNTYRNPASSNGYWIEGTAGTATNINISTTYTFNYDIKLDPSSTKWGANVVMPGWTITQTDARTIVATYYADTWEVSTAAVGSGDATGFFLNFHVATTCLSTRVLKISSSTVMTFNLSTGQQTYTKSTGPTGV